MTQGSFDFEESKKQKEDGMAKAAGGAGGSVPKIERVGQSRWHGRN
jgi:hypothetical protein